MDGYESPNSQFKLSINGKHFMKTHDICLDKDFQIVVKCHKLNTKEIYNRDEFLSQEKYVCKCGYGLLISDVTKIAIKRC